MTSGNEILADDCESGDPRDRRREERLEYSHPCAVSVTAPVWAITNTPIQGRTEDVTLHGMRLRLDEVNPQTAASWNDAVKNDTELCAQIVLTQSPPAPILKGQIVWIHPDSQDDGPSGGCHLGILFSIMKEQDQRLLQLLIASIGPV